MPPWRDLPVVVAVLATLGGCARCVTSREDAAFRATAGGVARVAETPTLQRVVAFDRGDPLASRMARYLLERGVTVERLTEFDSDLLLVRPAVWERSRAILDGVEEFRAAVRRSDHRYDPPAVLEPLPRALTPPNFEHRMVIELAQTDARHAKVHEILQREGISSFLSCSHGMCGVFVHKDHEERARRSLVGNPVTAEALSESDARRSTERDRAPPTRWDA
jgi:hypothetical protein